MNKKILLVLLLLNSSFSLLSNDGGYQIGNAGTLIPILNENISMEYENIKINVFKTSPYDYKAIYNCTFVFKNNSDKSKE